MTAKGTHPSEDGLANIRAGHVGTFKGEKNPCWGKFGPDHPAYGRKHSKETIEKMRSAALGRVVSEETRQKIRDARARQVIPKRSEETKKKIGENWFGRHHSEESRLKMIDLRCGGIWYGNVKYDDRPQYCERFNTNLRARVRTYWGNQCVECGTPHTKRTPLSVHHVHYNKRTCCDGSPHDLVPLCKSCHARTNTDRDYWEHHFTEMIYALNPDGKCFLTLDEMAAYTDKKRLYH